MSDAFKSSQSPAMPVPVAAPWGAVPPLPVHPAIGPEAASTACAVFDSAATDAMSELIRFMALGEGRSARACRLSTGSRVPRSALSARARWRLTVA